jgi:hypothetical protein
MMPPHTTSASDQAFVHQFETGQLAPSDFNHRAHVALAYCYLCEGNVDDAYTRFKQAIHNFLAHHRIDASKYHETLTRAWLLAVRHFMMMSEQTNSADVFIEMNTRLLEHGIMLTHYSEDILFSDAARMSFVTPNLEPIPHYPL